MHVGPHGEALAEVGVVKVLVIVEDASGEEIKRGPFEFGHPDGISGDAELKTFVRDMVTDALGEEHVKDIDWDRCVVLDGDKC